MTHGAQIISVDWSNVGDKLAARSVWQETSRSSEIGDCLVWIGAHIQKGYGNLRWDGRNVLAHKAFWISIHGSLPTSTPLVLHHCDNPPCWRPDHLYLGTDKQNAADRSARGRHWAQRRSECGNGHELAPENIYIAADGFRRCVQCRTDRNKRRRQLVRGEQ